MEDNLTSADPLSYTTNGSPVDLVHRENAEKIHAKVLAAHIIKSIQTKIYISKFIKKEHYKQRGAHITHVFFLYIH